MHDQVDVTKRRDLFRSGAVDLAHAVGNQQCAGRVGHESSIGNETEESNATTDPSGLTHPGATQFLRELLATARP